MAKSNDSYAKAGVDYSSIDPIKVLAQKMAAETGKHLKAHGHTELTASRGESAYVWEERDYYVAFVIEGLGTKNLIADATGQVTGKTYYGQIAQDTVATIVNDLIIVGAMPKVINAYWAVGDSKWMADKQRAEDLVKGWANACEMAGAAWGGGETPILKDIIQADTIDLAGAAVGEVKPKSRLVMGDKLMDGDAIVLIESSGIHANGITLVRGQAEKRPELYRQKLADGRLFGEALLTPAHIYVALVKAVLDAGLEVHYMVNITGHGWRKLMRAEQEFSYEIESLPLAQQEFDFIQQQAGIDDEEMYGTFNMGAGFAIMLPVAQAAKVVELAESLGLRAWQVGTVKKGPRQVVIKPKNITFAADSLEVR
ncbi:phosphoribosylformylglycinamidine cyclo-ligase [Candidatus Saccharibacteria bacterium RIFCSPHIGHO2_12_FULL_47_16b]|nr:MAG: phosphoribosylformylglycinamidine cyclo-ligase [Candidatus Saccharibacteria bacterium RIFCSPHIGHO2_12_FULL_47_16b]